MTSPTPTPAHHAFRTKTALRHADRQHLPHHERYQMEASFLAGMEAEHEVARLMGQVEAMEHDQMFVTDRLQLEVIEMNIHGAKTRLAALLEGK